MKFISVIVESQVNVLVQPVDAEAYLHPDQLMQEMVDLVEQLQKPVTLITKHGGKFTMRPQNV